MSKVRRLLRTYWPMAVMFVVYGIVGTMDYQDQIAAERTHIGRMK